MITQDQLKELLHYDPVTGIFTWLVYRNWQAAIGDVAGSLNSKGYRSIKIGIKKYKAHRLAWLYVYGTWPKEQIDHINGKRNDNLFDNLREATNTENARNSSVSKTKKSGLPKGVQMRRNGKFEVYIRVNNKNVYVGGFRDVVKATEAYAIASQQYYGIFGKV